MFDIGFFEVFLIGIIALVVIGPEKLPRVARIIGLWLGRAQGMVKTVKYEIDEQLRMEELKQSMQKQKDSLENNIKESITTANETINKIKPSEQQEKN
ncbi:MAG: Sec-independent protein translocase protein TatB [Cycloclasticus sp.]